MFQIGPIEQYVYSQFHSIRRVELLDANIVYEKLLRLWTRMLPEVVMFFS